MQRLRFLARSPIHHVSGDESRRLPWLFGLVLRALFQLLFFDLLFLRLNFAALHNQVRSYQLGDSIDTPEAIERICAAVDYASICYFKPVLCLQRSAALACLLKRFGIPAQMVIGVQQRPFKAHAWVEVDNRVVGDKSYTAELYQVLDRC